MSGMAGKPLLRRYGKRGSLFRFPKGKVGSAKTNAAGSLGEKIYRGGIASVGVPACASCHGATGAGILFSFHGCLGNMQIT
jgi:mono/diheme cytochrome c family protein